MEKMTKKAYFNQIMKNYNLTADEIKFIQHEIELIDKKNSADRGPTATQLENNRIKAFMQANMGDGKYTITELIKAVFVGSEWPDISVSKATALARQMVAAGVLTQSDEKRKSYYSLVK